MSLEKMFLALIRFYEHNDPLVFLVPVVIVSLVLLAVKPRRRLVFLLIGALLLILEFEYTKVIFKEVQSDWLNQLFSEEFRFRKYQVSFFLFQEVVPFVLSFLGWSFWVLAALF